MNNLSAAIQTIRDHCKKQSRCATCQFNQSGDNCKFFLHCAEEWKPDWGNLTSHRMAFEQTEVCPHCEHENTLTWDVNHDGYRVFCPNCGEEMMLCDACQHADDNPSGYCDFKMDFNGIPTCFRRREHNDKTNN